VIDIHEGTMHNIEINEVRKREQPNKAVRAIEQTSDTKPAQKPADRHGVNYDLPF
jgi:hypothetical protein